MSKSDIENKRNIYATSLAASIASVIAKFTLHPIDTIKAKMQI